MKVVNTGNSLMNSQDAAIMQEEINDHPLLRDRVDFRCEFRNGWVVAEPLVKNRFLNLSNMMIGFLLVAAFAPVNASPISDNRDGTFTDNATGLMWQVCVMGTNYTGEPFTYLKQSLCTGSTKALNRIEAAGIKVTGSFANYDDWRIPTENELAGLAELRTLGMLPSDYINTTDVNRDIVSFLIKDTLSNTGYSPTFLTEGKNVAFVRTSTSPAPQPIPTPAPTGFSITGNEFNSPRSNKMLRADISGLASTNAVYIWAYVKGKGEFCYTAGTWTPYTSSYTLGGGKGRCPTPAGYLSSSISGSSASIDILGGNDLSLPLFDQTRVFVTLEPAGSKPTATIKNQKIMEFGGSTWE